MDKWQFYSECIVISSEVVSFRVEIYDRDTAEMVAKANVMINRRTKNGNIDWIVKGGTVSSESTKEIHKHCLKRMEAVGL